MELMDKMDKESTLQALLGYGLCTILWGQIFSLREEIGLLVVSCFFF